MPRLFVSATRQNVGKTTTSIGLFGLFREMGLRVHFIKPVGQRFVDQAGQRADEDAVLFGEVFGEDVSLTDMSPVTIPPGFTENYIFNRDRAAIYGAIDAAIAHVDRDVDLTIVEGTGHAGVGSVIDASNAQVAAHLGAKVIIIARAGIGSAIDEIALNAALFRAEGVPILGAIINKVRPEKYEKIERTVRQGLAHIGIDLLGVVPYDEALTLPTVGQLASELNLEVVAGHDHLGNRVMDTIVAAMTPQNTIGHIQHGTFVITPGDRIDNILVCIASHLVARQKDRRTVSGVLLSGGIEPDPTIMELLIDAQVPILISNEDTYRISAKVRNLVVKIGPKDVDKIEMARRMIKDHIDGAALLARLRAFGVAGAPEEPK